MEGENISDTNEHKLDERKLAYYQVLLKLYHLWKDNSENTHFKVESIEFPVNSDKGMVVRYQNLHSGEQLRIHEAEAKEIDWLELFSRHKIDVKDFSTLWHWDPPYYSLKLDILDKLEKLENQLWNLLQMARCQGGTKGHKVGGRWERIRDMREQLEMI
jgi:hypothetical protein